MSLASIMYMPHHVSICRPHMSREGRAGQFSAFAALEGHGDKIKETARITEDFSEYTEDKINELSWKIQKIEDNISKKPFCKFVVFIPDEKKQGGRYETMSGNVRRIDYYNRKIIFTSGFEISLDNIIG